LIWRSLFAIPAAALLLSGAGCIVTKSSYEMKVTETDTLRSALGALNREKAKLAEENAELAKQVAACREKEGVLAGQVKEMDESLNRRKSRDRFIDDLLEWEKETGQRMQELAERAEECEQELARRRGAAPRKPGNGQEDNL
jgi:hypothetical protein